MSAAAEFRSAVERRDLAGMTATLASDVVFHSPVTFHPFNGSEAVSRLLGVVIELFEDFTYVAELDGGGIHGLLFRARVGDREIEGIDLITENAAGLIETFTVMLRPMSATIAFAQQMGPRLEAIGLAPDRPA
jgi:SnoaL-like domain